MALFSEDRAVGSGRLASVAMMEATQLGQGDDVALFGWFHGPRFRSVLVQRSVRAALPDFSPVPVAHLPAQR